MSFWQSLPQPFFILAPMEDVTDTVFRQIIVKAGKPDLFYTEFTNVEGVQSVGQARVIHRLKYTEIERPIVAQVWGITPEDYYKTSKLIKELGFDGIDINMGCPVKNVIKMGACSALIKNPSLAKEIFIATKEGSGLPVSIKTRIGFSQIDTENWIGFLLKECVPSSLVVHGRTVKEESKVPCHWDEIGKAKKLQTEIQKDLPIQNQTMIIGNGDIMSYVEGKQKALEYNLNGIMIGRGVFHNPWIFNPKVYLDDQGNLNHINGQKIELLDRLNLLNQHLNLWQKTWGETKNYQILKKYFKIYIAGFPGSSDLRNRLMSTNTIEEAQQLVDTTKFQI